MMLYFKVLIFLKIVKIELNNSKFESAEWCYATKYQMDDAPEI